MAGGGSSGRGGGGGGGPNWLFLAAISTSLGCFLMAGLVRSASSSRQSAAGLQRQLPPHLSIPASQLAQYDNGSFTSNWWRLDQCITRANCPPDFFACQLPTAAAAAAATAEAADAGGLLNLWHHFLLLGWAFFTCHQVDGMRRVFQEPPSTPLPPAEEATAAGADDAAAAAST